MTGRKFSRLTVLSLSHKKQSNRDYFWNTICDCGTLGVVSGSAMRRGLTKSCGCLMVDNMKLVASQNITHGLTNTPTYHSWASMIQRCTNKNNEKYKTYGGRGISVCPEWFSFGNFLRDMGEKSPGSTIHRIDNDKGYNKSNCVWCNSHKTQARLKTSNTIVKWNGESHCLAEWSEIMNIPFTALRMRFHRGWSIKDALTKPIRKARKNDKVIHPITGKSLV